METINIGGLPFPASRIGLGTWSIGGWMWGGSDARAAIRTIQAAVDQGITLIDTAPVYGFGRSEELVGQALRMGNRRDGAIIATKCGLEWRDGEVFRNSSASRIRKEVEDSLRRLQTDRIDLYQVHWPDASVPIAETAETLARLVKAGKIRAIGVSNYSTEQMDLFRQAAPTHTVQPPYNLFERAAESDIIPYAKKHGIAVLAYGSLCRGLLTGRITAATTCATLIRSFKSHGWSNTWWPSRSWTSSRTATMARRSSPSRFVGSSTAETPSHSGVRVALSNSRRSPMCSAGRSIAARWKP
jgi:aryl-alcohol dehydrogenase-like predicted oxidoreductase